MSNRVEAPVYFLEICGSAGVWRPAAFRPPIGRPDAFHWQQVTGWSPVGGRVAQWNAPSEIIGCNGRHF